MNKKTWRRCMGPLFCFILISLIVYELFFGKPLFYRSASFVLFAGFYYYRPDMQARAVFLDNDSVTEQLIVNRVLREEKEEEKRNPNITSSPQKKNM